MRELSHYLTPSTHGYGSSEDSLYATHCLLRDEGTAARGLVWVLPAPLDAGCDVLGVQDARAGKDSARAIVPVFRRPAQDLRICRPHTSLAGARSPRNIPQKIEINSQFHGGMTT